MDYKQTKADIISKEFRKCVSLFCTILWANKQKNKNITSFFSSGQKPITKEYYFKQTGKTNE